MWRFWTKGWGFRAGWYWLRTEGFPHWVARQLPARVTYWAFIRVHANVDGAGGEDFRRAGDAWAAKHRL